MKNIRCKVNLFIQIILISHKSHIIFIFKFYIKETPLILSYFDTDQTYEI